MKFIEKLGTATLCAIIILLIARFAYGITYDKSVTLAMIVGVVVLSVLVFAVSNDDTE